MPKQVEIWSPLIVQRDDLHADEVDGNSLNQHPRWQDSLNSVNGVPGSRRYIRRGAHCVASSSPLNEISSFTGAPAPACRSGSCSR